MYIYVFSGYITDGRKLFFCKEVEDLYCHLLFFFLPLLLFLMEFMIFSGFDEMMFLARSVCGSLIKDAAMMRRCKRPDDDTQTTHTDTQG